MLITSIMGVEWRLPSSTDEQRGSQADQWVLPGGHTTTTTNTNTMHCTVCTLLEQAYYTAISLTHHVTINYMSSHRPMGLKSECSAQCVPGGPKLPAGGGSHISCSRPGGLKDISLDNHPVGLEVCLSVSMWASVCLCVGVLIQSLLCIVQQSVSQSVTDILVLDYCHPDSCWSLIMILEQPLL